MEKISGGTAVIIGASSGLGEALAHQLNRDGWRLGLLARRLDRLEALRRSLAPETLVRRNPQALQPRTLLRTWAHVLKNPTFWAFSLQTTATYGGLFTFLAASGPRLS